MSEEIKKLNLPITLIDETCVSCGIRFGVPDYYQERRKYDHTSYYCPNGHSQIWTGTNDRDLKIKYHQALTEIAALEVGLVFNKDSLLLAIKTAQLALK